MRAIVTVGLPGCGKSTYAERLMAQAGAAAPVELNLDMMRERVSGNAADQTVTRQAIALRNRLLNEHAHAKQDVIISDTHSRRRHRLKMIRLLRKLGYRVELVFFDVGLKTCLERNARRSRKVPEAAMQMLATRLRDHPPIRREAHALTVLREAEDPLLPMPALGGPPVA